MYVFMKPSFLPKWSGFLPCVKVRLSQNGFVEIIKFPKKTQKIWRISALCTIKSLRAEILQISRSFFGKWWFHKFILNWFDLYKAIVSPKIWAKNYQDLSPKFSEGLNLDKSCLYFGRNDGFINSYWDLLTFRGFLKLDLMNFFIRIW